SPDKVTVIRSGIRSDLRPTSPRQEQILSIGYLGQLDRRKRVDLLLKAFSKSSLNAMLLIAGTGPDASYLQSLTPDKRIRFLGRIPDEELVRFYNSVDVLVFPTWLEGYGLPIVEAMACGRPVVVLGDAKIPSEVKNRCVIVQEFDTLFGNPKYFQSRCAFINYDSNYTWAKAHDWNETVKRYIQLYKEVSNVG
ncbi:MAG: glycosyltransferase, partial [Gammaproteobacteria bacterium]|nr:glycosyltransferase [Gammaproteobacteria bacterium]